MENTVTRSKYVNETIPITFDFLDSLKLGETVQAATIIITVFSGSDPDPSSLLYQAVKITGTVVSQDIRLGIAGTIYEIVFEVAGTLGTTSSRSTSLAILLQDGTAIPSYTVIYETSALYPLQSSEAFSHTLQVNSISLNNVLYHATGDQFQHSLAWLSMALTGGTVTYNNPPEDLQHSLLWVSASLYGSLVTYNAPSENFKHQIAWLSMSLYGTLLTYANPTENMQHSLSWQSMSLV